MQVAYAQDHVTHAVIGGGSTIDFGISNSAEFFNILSSTLYKDQILAVVRETICNAWDAHIEAGITDTAIEISLDNNKLTIKDFGKGIHHDDIGIIYGTYGNSTKKNDGNQTGGFGLGCKSPFAYTDHFEVVSQHDGVRTIYAMAKSSAQVGGKPGITTIAQFPTQETGLTVSLMVSSKDVDRFSQYIKTIVFNGSIKATLNGKELPTMQFDTTKSNWLFELGTVMTIRAQSNIQIRYGNVIYLVDCQQPEIYDLANQVEGICGTVCEKRSYYANYVITFQAPPHSIAVTPSRESLSMQTHTINTLKQLFTDFIAQQLSVEKQVEANFFEEHAQNNIKEGKALCLLSPVAAWQSSRSTTNCIINNAVDMVKARLKNNYKDNLQFRRKDTETRVRALMKEKLVPQGLAQSYLKALEEVTQYTSCGVCWDVKGHRWTTEIAAKVAMKLMKAGLSEEKLYVSTRKNATDGYTSNLVPFKAVRLNCLFDGLSLLKNTIVLTTTKDVLRDRIAVLKTNLTSEDSYFVYVVGRKKDELEAAQEYFKKSGMNLIDMTVLEVKSETEKKPATPRLKGLPLLKAMRDGNRYLSTENLRKPTAERTETPLFITQNASTGSHNRYVPAFHNERYTQIIIEFFGDKVGVACTAVQFKSWNKKFPTEYEYLSKVVLDYVKNSTSIKKVLQCSSLELGVEYWIQRLLDKKYIRKSLDLVDESILSEEEAKYLDLFWMIRAHWAGELTRQGLRTEYEDLVKAAPSPKVQAFLDKVSKSNLIKALDFADLDNLISNPATTGKALKMFYFALNN